MKYWRCLGNCCITSEGDGGVERKHGCEYGKAVLSALHPRKDENVKEGLRSQFALAEKEKSHSWLRARGFVLDGAKMTLWV